MHDNILGLTSGNTICVTCNMFGDDLQNTASLLVSGFA